MSYPAEIIVIALCAATSGWFGYRFGPWAIPPAFVGGFVVGYYVRHSRPIKRKP